MNKTTIKTTREKVLIKSPRRLSVEYLDTLVTTQYRGITDNVELLIIDLRNSTFIEVSSLIYLLSLIEKQNSLSCRTLVHLPRKKSVRDFLRLWGFDLAVFDHTGRRFSHFCNQKDVQDYFSENACDEDFTYKALSKVLGQLINNRFFSISTCAISKTSEVSLLLSNESARWKGPLIQDFLRGALDGGRTSSSYVSSRIVYEAMTNALRHPQASIISSTAFCNDKPGFNNQGLTMTFWDNGKPMHQTLHEAIQAEKEVRGNVPIDQHFTYDVSHCSGDGCISNTILKTDKDLKNLTQEYEYFLACLFPGVSRDLDRTSCVDLVAEPITEPGWGLVALLNCACEIFNGSVTFRSGNIHAKIKKCENLDESRFRVSVTEYDEDIPPFNGNMVTIFLPKRDVQ